MSNAAQQTQSTAPVIQMRRTPRKRYDAQITQVRVSASFATGEVEWLNALVTAMLNGRESDVRMLARHKAMARVARKARSMSAAIAAKLDARRADESSLPHKTGLSPTHAARALGIPSRETVLRWIKEGKLGGVRYGRHGYRSTEAELELFRQQHAGLLATQQRRKKMRRPMRAVRGAGT